MTETSLEVTDRESQAVQKTPNRVSLDYIKSRIKDVGAVRPDDLPPAHHIGVAEAQKAQRCLEQDGGADHEVGLNHDRGKGVWQDHLEDQVQIPGAA